MKTSLLSLLKELDSLLLEVEVLILWWLRLDLCCSYDIMILCCSYDIMILCCSYDTGGGSGGRGGDCVVVLRFQKK